MSTPRSAFMLALAGLIDAHLDDGLPISAVATGLRLQLLVVDLLDQDRRYLPELTQARPFDPSRPASGGTAFVTLQPRGAPDGLPL